MHGVDVKDMSYRGERTEEKEGRTRGGERSLVCF